MSLKDKLKCFKIEKKSLIILSPKCYIYYLQYSFTLLFFLDIIFLNTMLIIISFSPNIRLFIPCIKFFISFIIIILTVAGYYWVSEN